MTYLKKPLDEAGRDELRINLSAQPRKLGPEPVCDFCGSTVPLVIYASYRMSTGEIRTCWRWAACGTCENLVDHNKWEEIEQRLISWLVRSYKFAGLKVNEDLLGIAARASLKEFHGFAIKV